MTDTTVLTVDMLREALKNLLRPRDWAKEQEDFRAYWKHIAERYVDRPSGEEVIAMMVRFGYLREEDVPTG